MPDEPISVGVRCGKCGSDDIYMLACPDHEWAIASICHGCQFTYVIEDTGHCPECDWPLPDPGGRAAPPPTTTTTP